MNDWQGSRVFITGATGLLGSHLTRALVERGADVVALVRRTDVSRSLFGGCDPDWELERRVTTVPGVVEDLAVIERVLAEYEIDTVFHLAAQTIVGQANREPLATFKANIEGTWNVLEAVRRNARTVKRVVVASSDKAYGPLDGEAYTELSPLRGCHPYDVSKTCADLLAQAYAVSYKLPVAVTRCGNFFGPGDLNFSRIIPGTIRSVLEDRRPLIRSDGTFVRDYIFAEDGAHAYLMLAEAMADGGRHAGEAFNFSYGLRLSVKDVVARVLAAMDREDLQPEIRNEACNEIPVQTLDCTKARRLLDWRPRFGFDEGLRRTIEWYRAQYDRYAEPMVTKVVAVGAVLSGHVSEAMVVLA